MLLTVLVGLVLWTGWRLTRPPVTLRVRWLVLAVLCLLLAGILLPPDTLQLLKEGLARLLPGISLEEGPDTSMLGHFSLFAALAALLFRARPDLPGPWLLGALLALAVTTELMQMLVEGREPDWRDVLVDLAGAGFGAFLAWALRWRRRAGAG